MKKARKLKRIVKNQKGLTLVELLAVIVILGIIAAIAVPSIGGIINNSQKDAHIANAEQMANAARLMATSGEIDDGDTLSFTDLEAGGFIESIPENPEADSYGDYSGVYVDEDENGNFSYYVNLADENNETIFTNFQGENNRSVLFEGGNQITFYLIGDIRNQGRAVFD